MRSIDSRLPRFGMMVIAALVLVGCQGKNVVEPPGTLQPPSVQMPGDQSYYPGAPASRSSPTGSDSRWAAAPPGPLSISSSASTSAALARARTSVDLSPAGSLSSSTSTSTTPGTTTPAGMGVGPLDPGTKAPVIPFTTSGESPIRIVEGPASSTRFSQTQSRGMPANVATSAPRTAPVVASPSGTNSSTTVASLPGPTARPSSNIPFTPSPVAGEPGMVEISQLPQATTQPRVAPATIRTRGMLAPPNSTPGPAVPGTAVPSAPTSGTTAPGVPGAPPAAAPTGAPPASNAPAVPRYSDTGEASSSAALATYQETQPAEKPITIPVAPATYVTPSDGTWERR